MAKVLKFEVLEGRVTPTTAADIAFAYAPGWNPVPGMPLDKVGVVSFDANPADPTAVKADIFFAMDGGSPRVRAIDTHTGAVVFDRIIFDEKLRTGITTLVTIDGFGYAVTGEGGGAVVAKIDLTSFAVTYFAPESFPESWRHGLKVYAVDVDAGNGTVGGDSPGGEELLVLPNGQAGGPVVYVFDTATQRERFAVLVGPADFRGELEMVPAGGGVQLSTGKMGAFWEEPGKPETTRGVAWDGTFAPPDHVEAGGRISFADPIVVG